MWFEVRRCSEGQGGREVHRFLSRRCDRINRVEPNQSTATLGTSGIMHVIVEMIGGPWDGFQAYSRSPDKFAALVAHAAYSSTGNGELGERFLTPSLDALEAFVGEGIEEARRRGLWHPHCYEVIGHASEDEVITLTMQYLPGGADAD